MKDELQALITGLEALDGAPGNFLSANGVTREQTATLLDRAKALDTLDEEQLSRAVAMTHEAFAKEARMFPLGSDGQLASLVLDLLDGTSEEDEVEEDEDLVEDEEEGL